jgi:archaellum component FlaF (FlaF/FlaG flagellin family)
MGFWKSLSTWSLVVNLDDLEVSISFLLSQVEAVKVEIFLSNLGSRKVNVEKSSIMHSFLVRAHNLQILRIEQGSTPRID